MRQFVTEITSPYWWLSVVVVGIVIHVIGTYAKASLDRRVVFLRARRHERDRDNKATRDANVSLLRDDKDALVMFVIDIAITILLGASMAVISIVCLASWGLAVLALGRAPEFQVRAIPFAFSSLVALAASGYFFLRASAKTKLLLEAKGDRLSHLLD